MANVKKFYLSNPDQLNYLLHQDRDLGEAIAADDDVKLGQIISKRLKENIQRKKQEMERLHRLQNSDIFDIEAQKQIEEEIRRSLVEENYNLA